MVTPGMGSPAPVVAFRSQLNQFVPGGLGFTGGGLGGRASRGGCTILASNTLAAGGSFQILLDYESRVTTPLTGDRVSPGNAGGGGDLMFGGLSASAFGRASGSRGMFDNEEEDDDAYPPPSGFVSTVAGVRAGEQVWHDSRRFAAQQVPTSHLLYGPHEPETRICGGVIARGTQGQFPYRFCLKTRCTFSSHVSKSNLNWLVRGAYYVRENDSYAYSELFLSPEMVTLTPPEVLGGINNMSGWKAII